jgi:aldehyde dehydrogenase (NAD+)
MDQQEIQLALENQRRFFNKGITLDIDFRIDILKKLRSLILLHEKEILNALWKDFHKPGFEVLATESRFVLKELNFMIRNLRRWSRTRRVPTPIVHFLSYSYITQQPYGQVLVLSPWNYPFQLAFVPVIGAIAAGNCVVLKTSQQVPFINAVMEKIAAALPQEVLFMANGDHNISDYLLDYKFDYIFFTGSTRIGRHVMQKASENLTPFSLELGGKNPCVVAADADLEHAAKRITWGKFLNAGQTCICTDYVLADNLIREKLLELIAKEISSFYGADPKSSNDFARIINLAGFNRISAHLKNGRIVAGGVTDPESLYIAPTVLTEISPDDTIMQDEIFGPVLPVLGFDRFEEVYGIIERNPNPLAVYIFSTSKKLIKEFLQRTKSGTAGINETVLQIASPYLPYGGVSSSGIGRYHGKKSFETFSNARSVLRKSDLFDLPLRYPPYNNFKEKIIRLFMR